MENVTKVSELRDNQEYTIAGRVIKTFERKGLFFAVVLDDSGKITVKSRDPIDFNKFLRINGKAQGRYNELEFRLNSFSELEEDESTNLSNSVEVFIDKNTKPTEAPFLIQDSITRSLKQAVLECARRLLRARFLLRPVFMRYHCDADGISGALSIRKSFSGSGGRFLSFQNGGATYELPDALRDINIIRSFGESTDRALFLFVDMCSGPENSDSLGVLKGADKEIIIIDHHPLSEKTSEKADQILSPMTVGANSTYTAGMLAAEVSKAMGSTDLEELQRISLAGDKSSLIEPTPEALKKALVIDYLGKYSKFPNTLDFYSDVFSNPGMLNSLHTQASEKMNNAVRTAKELLKVKESPNGFRLCTTNLEKSVRPRSFPGKGTVTGAIHDYLKTQMSGPLVTIGYSGRLISMRANSEARDRGFNANVIISDIKRELINAIETGGGHDVAASIHVNEGFENIVLEELIRHIHAL